MKAAKMTFGQFTFAATHDDQVAPEDQAWYITLCNQSDEVMPEANAVVRDFKTGCLVTQTYAKMQRVEGGWHWQLPAYSFNVATDKFRFSTKPIADTEEALSACLSALQAELERQRVHGQAICEMRQLLDKCQPEEIQTSAMPRV